MLALESRTAHVAELAGNPLGVELRLWPSLRASMVRAGFSYYPYFNAIRGVRPGCEADLGEALAWFAEAGLQTGLNVSPFASDASLLTHLSERGLRLEHFMSVLYADPRLLAAEVDSEVIEGASAFLEVWLEGRAESERAFQASVAAAEFADWRCYAALIDGRPVAMAGLFVNQGAGYMASAYTSPGFRGRGLQTVLLSRRIRDAAAAGCDLIVSTATPGSQSQRNIERLGLRTAYTQSNWVTSSP